MFMGMAGRSAAAMGTAGNTTERAGEKAGGGNGTGADGSASPVGAR